MSEPHVLVRVREVMKAEVDIIDGVITVGDALRQMKYTENRALIVDKRHADDEYGIVLLADIARLVLARDRSPDRVNAYEVMSKPVIGVPPDMDIRYCARLFEKFGLSRAPVIDAGKVVGLVSYNDLVLKGMLRG
jgi:CBS domain-containing protein